MYESLDIEAATPDTSATRSSRRSGKRWTSPCRVEPGVLALSMPSPRRTPHPASASFEMYADEAAYDAHPKSPTSGSTETTTEPIESGPAS